MSNNKVICTLVVTLCLVSAVWADTCTAQNDKVVVCYYGSWSVYREGIGEFSVDSINASLCTHLVYTFAGLDINAKITSLDSWNDIDSSGYSKFVALKEESPCLKTLLAIGGWNEGSRKYSVMASSAESRENFVESVLRFIVAYDFDGLDFDWEYPTERGGIADDKENFSELIKLLKTRFEKWGLLLTIAVPISEEISANAYDIDVISEYVDYVLVMAYDYTATTSNVTGLLAPLPSIQGTVNFWLSNGLPNTKLVLGIPTYARSFELEDSEKHGLGDAVVGPGEAGSFTQEQGFLSYYELMAKLSSGRYTIVSTNDTYYAYFNGEWLSFDLGDTYRAKVQYALENDLAGVMLWSVDTDDFGAYYNSTAYPVLTTIYNALYSN